MNAYIVTFESLDEIIAPLHTPAEKSIFAKVMGSTEYLNMTVNNTKDLKNVVKQIKTTDMKNVFICYGGCSVIFETLAIEQVYVLFEGLLNTNITYFAIWPSDRVKLSVLLNYNIYHPDHDIKTFIKNNMMLQNIFIGDVEVYKEYTIRNKGYHKYIVNCVITLILCRKLGETDAMQFKQIPPQVILIIAKMLYKSRLDWKGWKYGYKKYSLNIHDVDDITKWPSD